MAEDNKEEVTQEEETTQEAMDAISNELDDEKKELLDKKGKILLTIIIIAIASYGGWWAYNEFVKIPAETAAKEQLWWPENMMHFKEDFKAAIEGDSIGLYDGFEYIMDDISGTDAEQIAKFDLGVSYLNDGRYEEARTTLESVDFGDEMVSTVAKGAIGDCYMQEGDMTNAIVYYEHAINNSPNSFTCPLYLKKCALAYEALDQWEKAISYYERIKNEFPESDEALSADKYIVKAKANNTSS
jgi:tetratricopeptide (TPR) repeat protein